MLLQCNNKECRRISQVKLDPESNEVVCCDCGNVIKNVTEFVKVTLRSNKEFVKKGKISDRFNVKCNSCGRTVTPILKDKVFVCSECFAKMALSKPFESLLRQNIK